MSLINDALKRAKEAQREAPPARLPGPSLRPVDPQGHTRHTVGLIVPSLLAVMALLALFLVWEIRSQRVTARQTGSAGTEVHKEVSVSRQTPPTSTPEPIPSRVPPPSEPFKNGTPATAAIAPVSSPVAKAPVVPSPRPADANVAVRAQPAAVGEIATQSITGTVSTVNTNVMPIQQAPKPPPLVLQGVVFNPKRPSAVINGKTLFIGDRIRDFRVVSITVETATLVSARQTNVLTLAE